MKLCIVRHGEAGFTAPDSERELTATGKQQAKIAGQWLLAQFPKKPRLIASPYIRAQQTASIIAQECGLQVETWKSLTPEASVNALVDQLGDITEDVILVSHLPLVAYLAALLVDGSSYNQPWSVAECWLLEGKLAAAGCMSTTKVWYPVLAKM
ncbi:MAG TPA: phosphohistidine phosphatase SixA [Pseudomonadales bacterium]|nr:phosphohistidine phosphatase SixA [Pseudomonadales bacterium]